MLSEILSYLLIAPMDFTEINDELTFPSGATTGAMVCNSTDVRNDRIPEINETFMVQLIALPSDASVVKISASTATVTIIEDVEDGRLLQCDVHMTPYSEYSFCYL